MNSKRHLHFINKLWISCRVTGSCYSFVSYHPLIRNSSINNPYVFRPVDLIISTCGGRGIWGRKGFVEQNQIAPMRMVGPMRIEAVAGAPDGPPDRWPRRGVSSASRSRLAKNSVELCFERFGRRGAAAAGVDKSAEANAKAWCRWGVAAAALPQGSFVQGSGISIDPGDLFHGRPAVGILLQARHDDDHGVAD